MKTGHFVNAGTVVLAAILASGCAHSSLRKATQTGKPLGPSPDQVAAATSTDASREPDLRSETLRSIPQLKTVDFGYDSDFLTPEARAVLGSNAAWLKGQPTVRVQVAGNCDQRGTVEYNLALGQRRAAAVRQYYLHLGVAGNRVATISYGKEHPLCGESTEACWSQNRRAESLEAVSENVSRK